MVLNDLHVLIETLQARIDAHAADLQKSEALTRYALIDPLLRALNWDTADPSQVLVEYQSGGGSADYALRADGKPRIIVEAKRLGTPLQGAVTQGINYCIQLGIPYFALTDGQRWEIYETFRAVPLDEKMVTKLDVNGPAAKTCLDALALWRRSVVEGGIDVGTTPVVDMSKPSSSEPPPTTTSGKSFGPSPGDDWQSLPAFAPKAGEFPEALRLPSGTEVEARWWGPFIEAIVRYLSEQGHLTAAHLPMRNSNGRYVLTLKSDPPKGPQGQPVKNMRIVDQYLLNTNFQAAANAAHARLIIQQVGLDPADFAVRLQ